LHGDDRRLDPVLCPSGIDYEWNPSVQFIQNVLRCCRTDASEPICARGRERLIQFTHDFSKHTMRTESHRHRIQSRRNDIRNNLALWKNHRERPRPKRISESKDQLLITSREFGNFSQPFAIRQMNNKRIEAWSLLRLKNLRDGNRVECAGSEPVNSFGRQRDDVTLPQQFNRYANCSPSLSRR
jgi:hypothetical protein